MYTLEIAAKNVCSVYVALITPIICLSMIVIFVKVNTQTKYT